MKSIGLLKILLFGPPGVGKRSLIEKYCKSYFKDGKISIGVSFHVKEIRTDDYFVKAQIWFIEDRKGRLRSLLPVYSKGAHGTLLIFDITKSLTIDLVHDWIHFIREKAGDLPLMIIGNKMDGEDFHELTREKRSEIAKEFNLVDYIDISTKTRENVEKMFVSLE
ncbi:MAG: Rab family GTPase [Promethearchaeota archaeon]